VDRRRGAERRSNARSPRPPIRVPNAERPVEHVRNALQLLREVALVGEFVAGAERGPWPRLSTACTAPWPCSNVSGTVTLTS